MHITHSSMVRQPGGVRLRIGRAADTTSHWIESTPTVKMEPGDTQDARLMLIFSKAQWSRRQAWAGVRGKDGPWIACHTELHWRWLRHRVLTRASNANPVLDEQARIGMDYSDVREIVERMQPRSVCDEWDQRANHPIGTTRAMLEAVHVVGADLIAFERLKEVGIIAKSVDGLIELSAGGRRLGAASTLGGLIALLA